MHSIRQEQGWNNGAGVTLRFVGPLVHGQSTGGLPTIAVGVVAAMLCLLVLVLLLTLCLLPVVLLVPPMAQIIILWSLMCPWLVCSSWTDGTKIELRVIILLRASDGGTPSRRRGEWTLRSSARCQVVPAADRTNYVDRSCSYLRREFVAKMGHMLLLQGLGWRKVHEEGRSQKEGQVGCMLQFITRQQNAAARSREFLTSV